LVRPFTVGQLKELLFRTGKILNYENGGFWIDKIKSHAFVEYSTADEAEETAMALDGVKWPSINPKTLSVAFSTKKILEQAIESNELPLKTSSNKDYHRGVSSTSNREEGGSRGADLFRKRKYSDNNESADESDNHESSKRERIDSEKAAIEETEKEKSPAKPKKHLDDLFRKTKALPSIYWLPKQQKISKS
jgi:apoptotic chromatin condensation inducer in the nucleus